MRNKLIIIITSIFTFTLTSIIGFSQRPYTAPAAFLPSEKVKVIVSVFSTPIEDHAGPMKFLLSANDDEPNVEVNCELVSPNHWGFNFSTSPNDFFAVNVAVINLKIKTGDGSFTSDKLQVTPFDFSNAVGILTVAPSRPYFSENVSVIFDRTKSDRDDLSAVEPIYMWAWNNTEGLGDAADQGAWTSISESTVLTQVPGYPDLWRKDFIPQKYWNTTKPMTSFGCLFRTKAGDKQTNDQTVTLYKAPGVVEKPKKVKVFPLSFTKHDVVTIFYDQKLEENAALKASDAIYLTTTVLSTTYRPQPNPKSKWTLDWTSTAETAEIVRLKMIPYGNPSDSVFRITFVPQNFYSYYLAVPSALAMQKLFISFRNIDGTGKSEVDEFEVVVAD